jgi:ubiquinone/menaquinone biosynthesis C-methylase UbiE
MMALSNITKIILSNKLFNILSFVLYEGKVKKVINNMTYFKSHSHTHSHSQAPETQGSVLHGARFYNAVFSRMLKKSEPTILKLAGVKSGAKVLDVGCGPGNLTITAKKLAGLEGEVYGVDASVEMIEEARRQARKTNIKVGFEVGLAESLPYDAAKFDVVVSRLAFHHLPGDLKQRALAEIYRVLKPGGVCLVVDFDPNTVPGSFFMKKHLAARQGMMKVDVTEYIPLLEANNFTGIEWAPTGHRMLSYVKGSKSANTPAGANENQV